MLPAFELADALTGTAWIAVSDGDPRAWQLFQGHYSRYQYKDGRRPRKIIGPGEYILLLTAECDALFAWRRFRDASGQQGINCAIFRRLPTCPYQASALIRDAERWAWHRWPGRRLYTYVNPRKVASPNPGYCFKAAGWQFVGRTQKRTLDILAKAPLEAIPEHIL